MRVNLEWLSKLVDLTGLSLQDIVNKVSLYSIEVESVERVIDATNIVIGHVLTKTPHPDSDHLNVLSVDVGSEVLQIVCGAPNVKAGQFVVVSLVGATLPGGFTIKDSKIRGVESHGMVCSLQELGLENKYIPEEYAKGIYYFKDKVEAGMDARVALGFPSEVITLGLTPNRGDMLSMLGVAIEFSAAFNRPLLPLAYEYARSNMFDEGLSVTLESDKCLSYYAQIIRNVKIKESPRWLKARLISFGIRPINNVVDITNYVLVLFGQPLHAFDLDELGNKIVVRCAKAGEKLTTLDGIERELVEDDLLITDGKRGVCLAGVMGGLDSEITENTKNVLIEAAVFDPLTIRKTAARLNLHSESSARFERGVDLNRTLLALDYTNYLFKELCDADIEKSYCHAGIKHLEDREIDLTLDNVNGLLGSSLTIQEVKAILESLGMRCEKYNDLLKVYVPSRRSDITIMQDLVEEVGRLYGYENITPTLPSDNLEGGLTNYQKNEALVRTVLSEAGLFETITYSLVTEAENLEFNFNHIESENVKILMPLTNDHEVMRKGLVPSLVNVVSYNHSRKNKNYNVFEIGKVYGKVGEEYKEEYRIAGAMSGMFSSTLHQGKMENVDFFLMKGIIEKLLDKFRLSARFTLLDKEVKELHPNKSASIYVGDTCIGFAGQVHPKYAKLKDIDPNTYVFEIDGEFMFNQVTPTPRFSPITKLPTVERDIAIVVKKEVSAEQIITSIRKSDRDLLANVKIFDVYTGDKVGEDEKSVALKLTFSSPNALTDGIVNEHIKKILKDLAYRCSAKLREF